MSVHKRMVKRTCPNCGAEGISLNFSGDLYWNYAKQDWELAQVLSEAYCFECSSTITPKEEVIYEEDDARLQINA